jgi:hypothetical protein
MTITTTIMMTTIMMTTITTTCKSEKCSCTFEELYQPRREWIPLSRKDLLQLLLQ